MKTAEEFLRKNYPTLLKWLRDIDMPAGIDEVAQEAMQEYHKDELKDELAKFMEFEMSCSIEIGRLSDNKFIDEYLKQRP